MPVATVPSSFCVPKWTATLRVPDASAETREAMEALSTAIVNKILHAPVTKLRESSRAGAGNRENRRAGP